MAWSIKYSEGALKDLKKLDAQTARRIVRFLGKRIATDEDPHRLGDALQGSRLGEFWKYRVGDYRVICQIQEKEVIVYVLKAGHRSKVYKAK